MALQAISRPFFEHTAPVGTILAGVQHHRMPSSRPNKSMPRLWVSSTRTAARSSLATCRCQRPVLDRVLELHFQLKPYEIIPLVPLRPEKCPQTVAKPAAANDSIAGTVNRRHSQPVDLPAPHQPDRIMIPPLTAAVRASVASTRYHLALTSSKHS